MERILLPSSALRPPLSQTSNRRSSTTSRKTLNVKLDVVDGGTERKNLQFRVIPTTEAQRLAHLHDTLESYLPSDLEGGAIIYCATRRNAEKIAEFLNRKGTKSDHFHAGLTHERKETGPGRLH